MERSPSGWRGTGLPLIGGDTSAVEMLGDRLGRGYPHRLGGLDFDDEVPHKRLDFLSSLRHSMNALLLISSGCGTLALILACLHLMRCTVSTPE